jgi:hypothetical protein
MARTFSVRESLTNPAVFLEVALTLIELTRSKDQAIRNKAFRGLLILVSHHLRLNCNLKPASAKRLARLRRRA